MKKLTLLLAAACLAALMISCGNPSGRKANTGEPAAEPAEEIPAEPLHGPDSLNDAAAIFSGLAVDSTSAYFELTQNAVWRSHAKLIGERWAPCKEGLDKVDAFARDTLADLRVRARTVLYTFSGPDLVYPAVLFPDADTIIMAALEPVGKVLLEKDLNKKTYLRSTPALSTLMKSSYFITKSMKDDLGIEGLGGVTPVFEFFLSRLGYEILSIGYGEPSLVEIKYFHPEENREKVLRYYNVNLRNGGMPEAFKAMLSALDPGTTVGLFKSCSYCMHEDQYSEVRDYVLDHSFAIVQDDTGVRLKLLQDKGFDVKLYGKYTHPLAVFGEAVYQSDLTAAYKSSCAGEVDFRFGYNHTPAVMIARKK